MSQRSIKLQFAVRHPPPPHVNVSRACFVQKSVRSLCQVKLLTHWRFAEMIRANVVSCGHWGCYWLSLEVKKNFPQKWLVESLSCCCQLLFSSVSDLFLPELHGWQITAFESVKGECWNSRPTQRFWRKGLHTVICKAQSTYLKQENVQSSNPESFFWTFQMIV